jgi:hypothetical protein
LTSSSLELIFSSPAGRPAGVSKKEKKMFTIKYRQPVLQDAQPANGPAIYTYIESLHGPFDGVSQSYEDGWCVVKAHRGHDVADVTCPGMTFGPVVLDEAAGEQRPRPTLWVMNEQGATLAKYNL